MKVLITGAAGFLGSHIVEQCLMQGDEVRVIVRKSSDLSFLKQIRQPIEFHFGDLTDLAAVSKAAETCEVIYHSAGRVMEYGRYEEFYTSNCLATRNLLQAALDKDVRRFVFVSSPSIFADHMDHLEIDESVAYPRVFANFYAETKAMSEQEVLQANSAGLVTCSLRPRAIWGPRDKSGFVPKLLSSLAKGKLRNLAPGKQVLSSICHVENIARACLAAAVSPNVGGQAYFIVDREPVVLWDFLNELAMMFDQAPIDKSIHPKVLKRMVDVFELIWSIPKLKNSSSPPLSRYTAGLLTKNSTYSIAKAQNDFGYNPSISKQEGLLGFKNWVDQIGGFEMYLKQL